MDAELCVESSSGHNYGELDCDGRTLVSRTTRLYRAASLRRSLRNCFTIGTTSLSRIPSSLMVGLLGGGCRQLLERMSTKLPQAGEVVAPQLSLNAIIVGRTLSCAKATTRAG